MTVKVKRKEIVMGREVVVSVYLPKGSQITSDRRKKADMLYVESERLINDINTKFGALPAEIRKDDFKKWKWLGGELASSIKMLSKRGVLEQSDIDNYSIWAGLGQFFRPELSRGVNTKRSGDKKDHYRKCWLLASTPHTGWIKTWTGWDAFVDRGEQLIGSNKIMPILDAKLSRVKLGKSDYQNLAREIANELPSGGRAATIAAMSNTDLKAIIDSVCDNVLVSNTSYASIK